VMLRRGILAALPLDGVVTRRIIVGRAASRLMVYVLFLYTSITIDVWLIFFLFRHVLEQHPAHQLGDQLLVLRDLSLGMFLMARIFTPALCREQLP